MSTGTVESSGAERASGARGIPAAADGASAARYDALRQRVASAASGGSRPAAIARLLARAAATDALHPEPVLRPTAGPDAEPSLADDQVRMLRAVVASDLYATNADGDPLVGAAMPESASSLGSAEQHAVAQALFDLGRDLDPEDRALFDVLVRRGLDPFEALATVPLEALFDADEQAALDAARRLRQRPTPRLFTWRPGQDADYGGYVGVIFKVTRWCNLRCTYCHDWRTGRDQAMSFGVLRTLFERLLEPAGHGNVDVIWHGGEPTILDRRAFLRILALQRHFQRPGQRIQNSIQTNATRIDDEWVGFLRRYRFSVSVSLDGPPEVHDRTRVDIAGRGSFDDVRRGLELLRDAGLLRGVLLVITPEILELGAERLLAFFLDEGIDAVDLLPARPNNGPGAPGLYIEPTRFARFLVEMHRARQARGGATPRIRMLDSALQALHGEMPGFCELLGNCIGSFFAVDPDGSVSHCDKYVGDPAYVLGNVLEHDFDSLRRSEAARRIRQDNERGLARQAGCEYFEICRGWCPHERYVQAQRGDIATCCGLRPLFDQLRAEDDGRAVSP
ncbi:MAG: radical SAM protein [Acidobacteriota bacterium]